MKILACDTALGALSAAVTDDGRVRAHEFIEMSRGHAEQIAPMVGRVMREAGLSFDALDRLAVTTGPGTFAGQRVGLAFMRASAMALGKPLIGITTLAAMAAEALARMRGGCGIAVADAKRGEVYLGALDAEQREVLAPALVPFASAIATIAELARRHGAPVLSGTGVEAMLPALASRGIAARDSGVRQPNAVFVARLAAGAPVPDAPPKPLYLRAPDAKLPS